MTDRQSTHGHDCWCWGPKHYECAVAEIERLREQLRLATVDQATAEAEAMSDDFQRDALAPLMCPRHDCESTRHAQQTKDEQLVHRVCNWIAEEIELVTGSKYLDKCKQCPAKVDTPYGEGQQVCFGRASELIELVRSGS